MQRKSPWLVSEAPGLDHLGKALSAQVFSVEFPLPSGVGVPCELQVQPSVPGVMPP